MEGKLNHFDDQGRAVMVDVSEKAPTLRAAVARGALRASRPVLEAIAAGTAAKGDVLGVARVAGIQAAKRTWELIPLCHPLMLTHVSVDLSLREDAVEAACTVRTTGRTGVEMEALTGVSTALLTVYDMCKALDKGMVLTDIRLEHKEGGRSGAYDRPAAPGAEADGHA